MEANFLVGPFDCFEELINAKGVVPMELSDFGIQAYLLFGRYVLWIVFIILGYKIMKTIYKKIRYRIRIRKLWKALLVEETVVNNLKQPMEDLFHKDSSARKLFTSIEVLLNTPIIENCDRVPVRITKLKLSKNKVLTLFVDIVQKAYEFEVLNVFERKPQFGSLPPRDDGVRLNLYTVDLGEVIVKRHLCGIPDTVCQGDKIRLEFVENKACMSLVYRND
ncbi:MAG: hypothetical protein LBR70_01320 [Lactobacillaceae bacterium]|jgi:hypothetical protein|nr:hypothetical protein [Lactobacillaceae bacterium]